MDEQNNQNNFNQENDLNNNQVQGDYADDNSNHLNDNKSDSRLDHLNDDLIESKSGSKWFWAVLVLVVALGALYFSDFRGDGNNGDNNINGEDVSKNDVIIDKEKKGEIEKVNNLNNQSAEVSEVGKGKVSFLISAVIGEYSSILGSGNAGQVMIREIQIHNPHKDSWALIYEGFRPLNLIELANNKEKHNLIEASLAAIDYDKVRIKFADQLRVDEKGEQVVDRYRTVDLAGLSVTEGGPQIANIEFNLDNVLNPEPNLIVTSN